MRRLKGCLVWGLALTFLILVGGWALFPPALVLPESVRAEILRRLEARLGLAIRAGHLRLAHVAGRVEIASLAVAMPGETPFLTASEAVLTFPTGTGLTDFVLGRAEPETLEIDGVHCDFKASHPDLTMAPSARPGKPPPLNRVRLGRLHLSTWAGEFGFPALDLHINRPAGLARAELHLAESPFGGEVRASGTVPLASGEADLQVQIREFQAGAIPGLLWVQWWYGLRVAGGTFDADLAWHGPIDRWLGKGALDLVALARREVTGRLALRGVEIGFQGLQGQIRLDLERPGPTTASWSLGLAAATGSLTLDGSWNASSGLPGRIEFQLVASGFQVEPDWLTRANQGRETGIEPGLIAARCRGWTDGTRVETQGQATGTRWWYEGKPLGEVHLTWDQVDSSAVATFTAQPFGATLAGSARLERLATGPLVGEVVGRVDGLDLAKVPLVADLERAGICRGPFRLRFPAPEGKVAYEADLEVVRGRVGEFRPRFLSARLKGVGGQWELYDPLAIFDNGGRITLKGRVSPNGYAADASCEGVDLGVFGLSPTIASGPVSFAGSLSGPLDEPVLRGNLWTDQGVLFGHPLTSFKAGLELAKGRLTLTPIQAQGPGDAQLDGYLAYDFRLRRLIGCHIGGLDLDLNLVKPLLGPNGNHLDGRVSGYLRYPDQAGRDMVGYSLRSIGLRVGSETIDALEIEGTYEGGQGEIRRLEIDAFRGTITGQGRFLDPGTFLGTLRADRLQVSQIRSLQSWLPAVKGEVTLDGHLNWSPGTRTGRFTIVGKDLWVGDRDLGTLGADVIIDPERLQVATASFDRIGVSAAGELRWGGRQPYRATLHLDRTDLSFIPVAHGWKAFGKDDLVVDGQCRVEGTLADGPPDMVDATLARVQIRRGQDVITAPRPMEIRYQNGLFELRQCELGFKEGLFGVQGTYEPGGTMALTVTGSKFSLLALGNLLEIPGWSVDGDLSLQATLHGTADRPSLKGMVRIHACSMVGRVVPEMRMVGELTPARLRLDELLIRLPHLQVTAAGTVPIPNGGSSDTMDLRVQVASGPLLDLPTYLPEVFQHASGTVRAGLHLTGHPRRPAVAGDFQVSADSLAFRGMRTPLKQVVIAARTQNGVIEVDPIGARLGRGTLGGRGRLDFQSGLGSMTIDLHGEKLDFAWGGLEANGVNLTVTGRGDPYHPVVRSLVKIPRGRFNVAESLGGLLFSRLPLPLESLDYRVDFEVPRNFWVRHTFLNAEMRGKVGVSGTLETFRLDGSVQCVQGWMFFQRRKFLVENGELRFGDREGIIDPHLFLKSSTNIQNTQVFLTLNGHLSSFTSRLYSSPPMAEGDLFALLTLGRSLEQAQQTDARDLFEKEILEGLKNTYLSGLLGSTLSTAFNLDELYLGSLFDRTTGITRSFLRIGKYIGRNFFFAYEGTMSNEGQKTYIIEYRLPRGFLLNLEVEKPINRTRIGVKYDWRF